MAEDQSRKNISITAYWGNDDAESTIFPTAGANLGCTTLGIGARFTNLHWPAVDWAMSKLNIGLTANQNSIPRELVYDVDAMLAARARKEYMATVRRRVESRRLDLEGARITVQDTETVRLLPESVVWPQLVVLKLRRPGRRRVYQLLLLEDSVAPGVLRRLRVMARLSALPLTP